MIEPCGFPFSLKAVRRAALDYAEHATILRRDSWADFQASRPPGRLILLTTAAEITLWDFEFRDGDCLLLGRESAGVPEEVHLAADARLRIPLAPGRRSLNVVTAAAIALGEAERQKVARRQRRAASS